MGGAPKGWESGQVSLAIGLVMGGRGKTFDQLKLVRLTAEQSRLKGFLFRV